MIRSRIAPTPSGYLHIGNAMNFALAWLWVRRENGSLRLRIDDLDTARSRPEYLDDIFKTLEWLGLDWDEGPQTPDEHQKFYSQNLRAERYNKFIEKIAATGKVFACSCSRKEIEGQYPGTCLNKKIPLNAPDTSLRIVTSSSALVMVNDIAGGATAVNLYDEMRDFIIRRRDGIVAYQIASVADDIDNKINLVIRGEDLLPSTAAQLYLAGLAGEDSFRETSFYHHPLLKDEQGHKLSKSAGSVSIQNWRNSGKQQKDFYRLISRHLGWEKEALSLNEMLQGAKQGQPLFFETS